MEKNSIPGTGGNREAIEEAHVRVEAEWNEDNDCLTIHLNKELVPVLLILVTPLLSFIMGFGLRSTFAGISFYYFVPLLLAVLRNRIKGDHIRGKALFFILLAVSASVSAMFYLSNFINLNHGTPRLLFSYTLIMIYFLFLAVSFWINNPYFAEYYRTKSRGYKTVYRILALFFVLIMIAHIPMYIKVYRIMNTLVMN